MEHLFIFIYLFIYLFIFFFGQRVLDPSSQAKYNYFCLNIAVFDKNYSK